MTDKLRAAAKAALETLEDVFGKDKIDVGAINNLRAALAEPAIKDSLTVADGERFPQLILMPRIDKDEPLYTAPPRREWVGLTDEEITEIRLKMFDAFATNYETYQAIETKLREKNT